MEMMQVDELLNYIDEALIITDMENQICRYFGKTENILCLGKQEMIGKNINEVLGISNGWDNEKIIQYQNKHGKKSELKIIKSLCGKQRIWKINDLTHNKRVERFLDEYHDNVHKELDNMVKIKTRELQELNNTLERKVERRTRELEQQKKKLEESLYKIRETQKSLVENEKMAHIGKLAVGLYHEISTPLGVCLMAVNMLDENLKKLNTDITGKGKIIDNGYAINLIVRNIERAILLIKSLRSLTGEINLGKKEVFSFRDVIDEIWDIIKIKYNNGNYTLRIKGNPNLYIQSYREGYFQIFRNFIENSIIHGFRFKQQGTIDITYRKIRDKIKISYRDDGRSIDEDIMRKIFDPFFTTRSGKGNLGMGLNIVQNLIIGKLHGSIQVFNLEKGVEFILRIPAF